MNIDRGQEAQAARRLPPAPAWLRRLGYYGLALALVALSVVVRIVMESLVGPGLPTYITFYPFVMLAALIGGWGPGVLARPNTPGPKGAIPSSPPF